jgi:hypothetical protein
VSALLKRLQQHPDDFVDIGDDAEARTLLLEAGLIDKFAKEPPSTPWFELLTYADHPTHWLIGMLFRGFVDAKDNGYIVRCYPRSQFSEAQMKPILDSLKHSVTPYGGTSRWLPAKPKLN